MRPLVLFTRLYGASPLHLLALLGSFVLTGYSATLMVDDPFFLRMLLWFGGAVLLHDVVLLPAYALSDRVLTASVRRSPANVQLINYIRIPILASGLLFLVFFPGIVRQGTATHLAATGQDQQPYLSRWLMLTAAFVALSALTYVLRAVFQWIRTGHRAAKENTENN